MNIFSLNIILTSPTRRANTVTIAYLHTIETFWVLNDEDIDILLIRAIIFLHNFLL